MKNTFKIHLPYLLVILAIVSPFFFKSGYLFMTDFSSGPAAAAKLDWMNGWLTSNIIFKILSFVSAADVAQKFYLSLIILLVLLGGKKIAEGITDDKRLTFIISLFFLFNPFVYDRIMYGQTSIAAGFGFLCFFVGYLLEYFKTNSRRAFLLSAVFAGLTIQAEFQAVFFVGLFYVVFLINKYIKNQKQNPSQPPLIKGGVGSCSPLIRGARGVFFTLIIIISLNHSAITRVFIGQDNIKNFIQSGIQQQDFTAFQTTGKTGGEALKNVVMMSGFWGKDQYRYADLTKQTKIWGRSFLLLLPIILYGIYISFKKQYDDNETKEFLSSNSKFLIKSENKTEQPKNSNLRYLSIGLIILFAISTILAVGIRLPIAREITYWLFDHFPFYKGMRETQKWVTIITIIYGIFLTIGAKKLFENKIVQNNKIICSVFLGAIIIMQAPLLLWGFWGQVKPTEYPADWHNINEFIKLESYKVYKVENQKFETLNFKLETCKNRILFLPWHLYMGFKWAGAVIANPAPVFFDCPVLSGTNMEWGGIYDNSQIPESKAVQDWLASKGKNDFIAKNELGISYIILTKEVDWKNYKWLNSLPGVKLEKETQTLLLYHVQD